MNEYKVTKSTTERYSIRLKDGWTWAIINISEDGDFNVISDYGNYSYAWRSFGDNFKKFLVDICGRCKESPMSYLYDKLHNHEQSKNVDIDATISNWKGHLFEKRRNRDITEEQARVEYDQLISFEDSIGTECSQDYLYMWFSHEYSGDIFDFDYIGYDIVHTYDRQCEAFCREIAPVFAEILKEEITLK
jgi:hypothetical protein